MAGCQKYLGMDLLLGKLLDVTEIIVSGVATLQLYGMVGDIKNSVGYRPFLKILKNKDIELKRGFVSII